MRTTKRYHQAGIAHIWELVVAVSVILVLLVAVLVTLGQALRTASGAIKSTQLRGLQGSLVLFAQGNNGFYPGFNGRDFTSFSTPVGWCQGVRDGRDTSQRFALLLLQNFFDGEYAISPADSKKIWTLGTVTTANYSYAMLELPQALTEAQDSSNSAPLTGRLREWSATNSAAPVLSDRSKAIDPSLITGSIWITSTVAADWRGNVAWNDNHVSFERSPILPTTRYGQTDNTNDDLFTATGDADAFMSYGK